MILITLILHNTNNKIDALKSENAELQYKVECLEQESITCSDQHADHYAFEEEKILQLIDADKADAYKHEIDSLKLESNNNIE